MHLQLCPLTVIDGSLAPIEQVIGTGEVPWSVLSHINELIVIFQGVGLSFVHVLQGDNDVKDHLAKQGVLHHSIWLGDVSP